MFRFVLALSLCISLFACSNTSNVVAVTVYPIQYLVERIGGDVVTVYCISEDEAIQTASLNEDAESILEKSQVLFYIQELEPYFDIYYDMFVDSGVDLVDLESKSVFYEFQRYTTTTVNGSTTAVTSAYYDGDAFDYVDLYQHDPIIWMDPISMLSCAEIIRDYLIEAYPSYESTFVENYESLEYDLTKLDCEYQELKDYDNIAFVCMTPSFGIWQQSYGIEIYPVCLSSYGALPSDEQLEIIKQAILDAGVEYIAYEPNLNEEMQALYDELKEELNLKEVTISNISSLSEEQAQQNKDYLTIMYENLESLMQIGANE